MGWGLALLRVGSRGGARDDAGAAPPSSPGLLDPAPDAPEGPASAPPEALLPTPCDRGSRTYWVRGADAPLTLVETDAAPRPRPRRERLRELIAEHERGRRHDRRTLGDPAFTETLFVELVRGGQHARAYALLAPECQRSWGDAERFAAAHRADAGVPLTGVRITGTRLLEEWVDPHGAVRHHAVAELDAEYRFGTRDRPLVLRRTVHLVSVQGRWRSLCYPAEAAGAAAPRTGEAAA